MSVPNSDCSGLKLTLKSCYRLMNSLHFRPDLRQENFCDELFDKYIACLKVICIFIFNTFIL